MLPSDQQTLTLRELRFVIDTRINQALGSLQFVSFRMFHLLHDTINYHLNKLQHPSRRILMLSNVVTQWEPRPWSYTSNSFQNKVFYLKDIVKILTGLFDLGDSKKNVFNAKVGLNFEVEFELGRELKSSLAQEIQEQLHAKSIWTYRSGLENMTLPALQKLLDGMSNVTSEMDWVLHWKKVYDGSKLGRVQQSSNKKMLENLTGEVPQLLHQYKLSLEKNWKNTWETSTRFEDGVSMAEQELDFLSTLSDETIPKNVIPLSASPNKPSSLSPQ